MQDKFSEYVFHVSSITNVRQQDKGRFFIQFRKKRLEFMAHNDGKTETGVPQGAVLGTVVVWVRFSKEPSLFMLAS